MNRDTSAQLQPDTPAIGRRRWLLGTGASLLAACTCRATKGTGIIAAHDASPPDTPRDDDEIRRLMRLANVPGLAIMRVDGSRVSTRGFGMTRASSGLAVDGDTVFEAASLSKQVFAYLVHRLAFEGALDLDRPVAEYLPLPNPADERARTITARHLLSHSSGWRNWRFNKDQALTSEFAPGSRWSYSGEGYYFLQRVVEHVTRKGILAITSERIFAPLGMRRSGYMWTPELDLRRAEPHTGAGAPIESGSVRMAKELRASGRPMEEWRHEDAERAYTSQHEGAPALPVFLLPNVAASLMTTADDLGRFYAHLLGDAEGRRALEAMTAPQVRINEALQWGLGVGLEAVNGAATRFWQWGDNTGFKHFLLGDRTGGGQALVVLTNGNSGRAVYERVIRRELGVDAAGFLII